MNQVIRIAHVSKPPKWGNFEYFARNSNARKTIKTKYKETNKQNNIRNTPT